MRLIRIKEAGWFTGLRNCILFKAWLLRIEAWKMCSLSFSKSGPGLLTPSRIPCPPAYKPPATVNQTTTLGVTHVAWSTTGQEGHGCLSGVDSAFAQPTTDLLIILWLTNSLPLASFLWFCVFFPRWVLLLLIRTRKESDTAAYPVPPSGFMVFVQGLCVIYLMGFSLNFAFASLTECLACIPCGTTSWTNKKGGRYICVQKFHKWVYRCIFHKILGGLPC